MIYIRKSRLRACPNEAARQLVIAVLQLAMILGVVWFARGRAEPSISTSGFRAKGDIGQKPTDFRV